MARSPQNDRLIYRDPQCYVDTRIDPRELLSIPVFSVYMVTDSTEYRPALISYLFYQTPDFWWIILDYNQVTFSQVTTGTTLRIPDVAVVKSLLDRSRRNRILLDGTSQTTLAGGAPTRRILSV